ncbi:MAG: type II toxin-antitoxin system RelE/ParE family toxin [Planctomycetia bacterium]|nr:type II toxin-antitoxin system RelE/ParE family toxin [Planctomycetia bacterium]
MYKVVWKPLADEQAGRIWLDHPSLRDRFTELIREIVERFKRDPLACGESRSGDTRILIEEFLVLFYDIVEGDSRVDVLAIRKI